MTEALRAPLSSTGKLRAFLSLARRSMQGQWAYRGSLCMGLISSAIGYGVLMLVWKQAYASRMDVLHRDVLARETLSHDLSGMAVENVPPLPASVLLAYLSLAFIVNFSVSLSVEARFGGRLQTGMIAFDLMRPLGCLPLHLAQALGEGLGAALLASILYVIAWCLLGQAVLPVSLPSSILGVASLGLAFLLNFAISFLTAQALFLTLHYYGLRQSRLALHYALSGVAAPLMLFPSGLRSVAQCLPFRHVVETPVSIWMGLVPASKIAGLLLQQVSWVCGLLLLAAALLRAWFKRHQLQGG